MTDTNRMTDTIFKPHSELEFMFQHLAVLNNAFKHQNDNPYPVNITKYLPQSLSELEVQRFNLSDGILIPSRFSNVDDFAMWILGKYV